MAADEAAENGASPDEAQFTARRDLGSTLRVKEQVRSEWFLPGVERLLQDLRYASRTLPRSPMFTSAAVLSLGMGIGPATAIFSLVEGVLLKPLAHPEAGRLEYIQEVVPALAHIYPAMPVNLQHFFYWRRHTQAFRAIAAVRADRPTLTGEGEPSPMDGIETTADLSTVLDVNMAEGRGFLPDEDRPGNNHVAVITDSLRRRQFRADAGVLGRSILLDGVHTIIVGILPKDFTFPKGSDLGPACGFGETNGNHSTLAGDHS
jgi:hypothetical protein